MSIYTDLITLLFDRGGERVIYLFVTTLPFFFLLSTEYSILVWESNTSTLVLKRDFHVPIELAFDQIKF